MATKRIEQWEVDRYWEIFSSLSNGGTHLDGNQAASVLKNSQLRDDQLERIWDLSDVDNDGRLDFEEFCVAMRLIFDLVNGEYSDVPRTLPDWLVPSSKAHLIAASSAISGHAPSFEPIDDDTDEHGQRLKDGFDWYMAPSALSKYSEIYAANKSPRDGSITFASLAPLYDSLDVPDTDVRSAWNLVNPRQDADIGKDACLAFLHVLANRHEGYRIPRSVPASLRATFERSARVESAVDSGQARQQQQQTAEERWGVKRDDGTTTGQKAKFGDAYLSRLGIGDRAGTYRNNKGTDFAGAKTDAQWEEVRLRKQLKELEGKMAKVEEGARRKRQQSGGRREDTSRPALVKRELEQLLDWKRRMLRDLESGQGTAKIGAGLQGVREEIDMVKEQVDGLEQHLRKREAVLDDLRRQVEAEKAGGR